MRFNEWPPGSITDPLTQYHNRVDDLPEFNNIGLNRFIL